MHAFHTPEPITIEIRNASGEIHVDLAETETTTVDVALAAGGALGFVDEIVRAFSGRRPDEAVPADRPARWWEAPSGPEAAALLDRVRVELAQHDEGATLIVDTDPAHRGWRTAFTIHVTAPAGSGVRITSQSADVTVTGTTGTLEVRTASGDVVTGEITGDALVHTASGDVRMLAVGGDLSVRSASGDITGTTVAGSASLHSTSGDVRVQAPAGDIEVRTVSGDVRIADLTTGLVQLTAVSGDVEVGVHPGSLAAVNLSTISGDTRSDLAVTDEPGPAAGADGSDAPDPGSDDTEPGSDEPGRAGTGLLDIRVRTTSGDIRLRRAVTV